MSALGQLRALPSLVRHHQAACPICACPAGPSTSGRVISKHRLQSSDHCSNGGSRLVIAAAQRGRPRGKSSSKSANPPVAQRQRAQDVAGAEGERGSRAGEEPDEFLPDDDLLGQEDASLLDAFGEGLDEGDEGEDGEAYEPDDDELLGDDEFEEDEFEAAATPALPAGQQGVTEVDEEFHVEVETVEYEALRRRTEDARLKKKETPAATLRVVELSEEDLMDSEEKAARARAVAPLPEGSQLSLNRQGYQAFQMGKVEFLVAETADGKLDLHDSFVYDSELRAYAPPKVSGDIPKGALRLQVVPWVERRSGDMLKRKEPMALMKRVYFIGIASTTPYRIAMDQVFSFDASKRTLARPEVKRMGQNIRDPVLRIRADGITIEDSRRLPPPQVVSMDKLAGPLPDEERERLQQERLEELEAEADRLDELEEMPDVPDADMM